MRWLYKKGTVKKMAYGKDLRERLDRLTHEIVQLKSILVYQAQPRRAKAAGAWRDLIKASEELSAMWAGCSAVEEIRAQRER